MRDRDTNGDGTLNERLYALSDANGNITALYNPTPSPGASTVAERFFYDPYGKPRYLGGDFASQTQSNVAWNILYGGYYYDTETGLYHVRNRMYHPLYGRWLQTDPLGFTDSYNLYQYAFSSPLTYVDPTGEGPFVILFVAAMLVLGAGARLAHTPEMESTPEYEGGLERERQVEAFHEAGFALSLPIFGGTYSFMRAAGFGAFTSGGVAGLGATLSQDITQAAVTGDPLYDYRDEQGAFSPTAFGLTYAASYMGGGTLGWGWEVALPRAWGYARSAFAGGARRMFASRAGGRWVSAGRSGGAYWEPSAAPRGAGSGQVGRLRDWWMRGSEADAYWRQLPLRNKVYYEVGQKTLSGRRFQRFVDLDPVSRGRALVGEQGWFRALVIPEGRGWTLGVGATFRTGPTPLVRYAVPRIAVVGGAVGAGGLIYYLWPRSDSRREEGQQR